LQWHSAVMKGSPVNSSAKAPHAQESSVFVAIE
jgi:hypothetical protein